MGEVKSLVGQRFGRLVVIERCGSRRSYIGDSRAQWKCKCDCGRDTLVTGPNLRNGQTKSCGLGFCRRRVEPADIVTKRCLRVYKTTARRRNLNFTLSDSEFKLLIFSKCRYCGEKSANTWKLKYENKTINVRYNGIDRVDNQLGYSTDNCVSCCPTCNFMKKGMAQSQFLKIIKKIARRASLGKI